MPSCSSAWAGSKSLTRNQFGLHFCVDPADPEAPPAVCMLNHFAGIPNLGGLNDQLILSPFSLNYEWYTDRESTCAKSQAHYCPFDDYWITVNITYNEVGASPNATYAVIRDFEAAQTDCIENGNCNP